MEIHRVIWAIQKPSIIVIATGEVMMVVNSKSNKSKIMWSSFAFFLWAKINYWSSSKPFVKAWVGWDHSSILYLRSGIYDKALGKCSLTKQLAFLETLLPARQHAKCLWWLSREPWDHCTQCCGSLSGTGAGDSVVGHLLSFFRLEVGLKLTGPLVGLNLTAAPVLTWTMAPIWRS